MVPSFPVHPQLSSAELPSELFSSFAQTNKKTWRFDLKDFCRQTDFIGLQILQVGEIQNNWGEVTFRAILMQAGNDVSFTEKSRFEKINGRWFYHSGEFL